MAAHLDPHLSYPVPRLMRISFASISGFLRKPYAIFLLVLLCCPAQALELTSSQFSLVTDKQLDLIGGHLASVQDRQGFMWFAGESGLARFDGNTVKIYRNEADDSSSISSSFVFDLLVDSRERMWVATSLGLNLYDAENDSFIRYFHDPEDPHSLSHNVVSTLLEDREGNLWIGTIGGGINRFDPESGFFTRFQKNDNLPNTLVEDNIEALHLDNKNQLWIGTQNSGLLRFDLATETFHHYRSDVANRNRLSSDRIAAMHEDRSGILWIGTVGGGLNRFDPLTGRFSHFLENAQSEDGHFLSIVQYIFEDNAGNLWVAGDGGGVNIFDRTTFRYSWINHISGDSSQAPGAGVRTVYQDRDGGLWFGSFPSGVARLNHYAKVFHNYLHQPLNPNSLSHNSILSLAEDQQGDLWVGTEMGLNHIDRRSGKITRYLSERLGAKSLGANAILAVEVDSQGYVWIGKWEDGLSRLDPKSGVFTDFRPDESDPRSLKDSGVWALLEDSRGTLWVGTERGGLNRYHPESNDFSHFLPDRLDETAIGFGSLRYLYEDREHNFWIGTRNGLELMDRETQRFTHFRRDGQSPHDLTDNHITSIYQDKKGDLWLGTLGGGVNRFDQRSRQFEAFRVKDGLADDAVVGVLEDQYGYLWISTGNGLSRFDLRTRTFKNFDKRHGLPGNNFNRPAYLKSSRGELIFGSTEGLSIFHPTNLYRNDKAPRIVVTDFQIFNKSIRVGDASGLLKKAINYTDEITIEAAQSVFSFTFAALDYHIPELNQYAYYLKGFDRSWNYIGDRRSATYTNLDPGTYIFRVKASNNEGVWNEEGIAITLHILPPWWRTWWAYSLYSMMGLCLVGGLIVSQRRKFEIERARAETEASMVIRLQEVDKLKDEFLANTSHELRTPLQGIIGLAETLVDGAAGNLSDSAKESLQMIMASGKRLSNLVNDILDFSQLKNNGLRLNLQPVDIYGAVELVLSLTRSLVGNKPLLLKNNIPITCPWVYADSDRLEQILHNLIGNSIKFTDQGYVQVSAHNYQGQIAIHVKDTGVGIPEDKLDTIFESFEQVHGSTNRMFSGTGLGLAVTKKIVELHGGKIWATSTLGEGTTLIFTLPMASHTGGDLSIADDDSNERTARDDQPSSTIIAHARVAEDIASNPKEFFLNHLVPAETDRVSDAPMHILVVDDESVNRHVLLSHLSLMAYRVTAVANGEEALNEIAHRHFDLVILDVMMPRLSGYDVCKIIRQRFPAAELPILFLTAKNMIADLVCGFEVGGNDFINKPVTKEELLARVKLHLHIVEVNRHLEHKIAERTQTLQEEHQRLQQTQAQLLQSEKMASLVTLVAGVTHEINNPINYTNISVYNLERDLSRFKQFIFDLGGASLDLEIAAAFNEKFSKLFRHLATMQSGTIRIKSLIDDLRLFSSVDEMAAGSVDLESCLQACVNLIRAKYYEQVDIVLNCKSGLCIDAHQKQINQVLMNIMLNGCQAIVQKQQEQRLPDRGTLTINAFEQNKQAVIEFIDNGCGMPNHTLQRVFEPFFTTKAVGEGVGLGLAISYSIVEQYQGRIDIVSELHQGTKVTLHFPVSGELDFKS